MNKYFKIPVTFTDLNLNEHDEIILYPQICCVDDCTPEESFINEIPYLRDIVNTYKLESGNVYNKDALLRIKILNMVRKIC